MVCNCGRGKGLELQVDSDSWRMEVTVIGAQYQLGLQKVWWRAVSSQISIWSSAAKALQCENTRQAVFLISRIGFPAKLYLVIFSHKAVLFQRCKQPTAES